MPLVFTVIKECDAGERRVAATPETVSKLTKQNHVVRVERGAGFTAGFSDTDYETAGANMMATAAEAINGAQLVLKIASPTDAQTTQFTAGQTLICRLDGEGAAATAQTLTQAGVTLFALERLPRITRAQTMDVLSSQANLSGYKAVLDAAAHYDRSLPMMMTAAGTVPAARVFIMGVGVAGLQAIATARRLGAIVWATDVRPSTKEEVESLGARFVAVEDEEFKQAQTAGGYAKEMSAAYQQKQQQLIAETIIKQDIVITTALIPGRPAPKLISAGMVNSMKRGTVIIDLAAETGGNCELCVRGQTIVTDNGVTIVGNVNVPSRLANAASHLYARNILAFINLITTDDTLNFDTEDEIINATMVAKDGFWRVPKGAR
jgi:NAD(P) transhydrogenase subunit alpha